MLKISINPDGNDRRILDYTLVLVFEGVGDPYTVTEDRRGTILDQNNRTFVAE